MSQTKRCSKCGQEKPTTEFNKRKASKDGLNFSCRECVAEYGARYYKAAKNRRAEYHAQYYRANKAHKAEYNARYLPQWRKANPEYMEQWFKAHPGYMEQWLKANPEYRPQYMAQYMAQYRKTPKGKALRATANSKRRALEQEGWNKLTPEQQQASWKRRKYIYEQAPRCAHCGKEFGTDRSGVEVDHIVPRALGGGEEADNLQALCITCNRKKGHRFVG